jgi:hypothetical protein
MIMIISNIIYINSGLFYVILFIVWITNLLISTLMLIQEPNNIFIRINQAISVIIVLYIIFLNIKILLFNIFI